MHSTAPASSGILTLSLPSGHLLVLKQQHQHGWQHPQPVHTPGWGLGSSPELWAHKEVTQRGMCPLELSQARALGRQLDLNQSCASPKALQSF